MNSKQFNRTRNILSLGLVGIFAVACSSGPEVLEQAPQFQVPAPSPISNSPAPTNPGNSGQSDADNGGDQGDDAVNERLEALERELASTQKDADKAKDRANWGIGLGVAGLAGAIGGGLWVDHRAKKRTEKLGGELASAKEELRLANKEQDDIMQALDEELGVFTALSVDTAAKMETAQKQLSAHADQIAGLEPKFERLQKNYIALKAESDATGVLSQENAAKLSETATELSALQTELDAVETSYRAELELFRSEVDTMDAVQKARLQESMTESAQRIESLQASIDSLSSELASTVESLGAQIAETARTNYVEKEEGVDYPVGIGMQFMGPPSPEPDSSERKVVLNDQYTN